LRHAVRRNRHSIPRAATVADHLISPRCGSRPRRRSLASGSPWRGPERNAEASRKSVLRTGRGSRPVRCANLSPRVGGAFPSRPLWSRLRPVSGRLAPVLTGTARPVPFPSSAVVLTWNDTSIAWRVCPEGHAALLCCGLASNGRSYQGHAHLAAALISSLFNGRSEPSKVADSSNAVSYGRQVMWCSWGSSRISTGQQGNGTPVDQRGMLADLVCSWGLVVVISSGSAGAHEGQELLRSCVRSPRLPADRCGLAYRLWLTHREWDCRGSSAAFARAARSRVAVKVRAIAAVGPVRPVAPGASLVLRRSVHLRHSGTLGRAARPKIYTRCWLGDGRGRCRWGRDVLVDSESAACRGGCATPVRVELRARSFSRTGC